MVRIGEKMVAIGRKATKKRKVGAVRFELTTFWTRTKRATRLRYTPPIKIRRYFT